MRVLVTGGSSDIGKAIVERRLRLGDEVLITASTEETLENTLSHFRERDLPVQGFVFDLATPEKSLTDLEPVLKAGIDALVLNAFTRTTATHRFHEIPFERLRSAVEPNLFGNSWLIQRLLPGMMERRTGRIIFISSLAAATGASRYSSYILAKSALEGLMRNLAVDYGEYGILSNIVQLGFFKTERTRRYWSRDHYREKIEGILPQKSMGEPEQAATALDSLLAMQQYINGSTLVVGGGFPMPRMEGILGR